MKVSVLSLILNMTAILLVTGFTRPSFSSELARSPDVKNIVLLISLDPAYYPKGIAAWLHDYSKYPDKLASTFTKNMKPSNYRLVIKNNADIYDLFQILHSTDTAAVFWISHEAPVSWSKTPGVQVNPLLVDYENADVKNVFTEISPTIRWISLIACDSQMVVNWLRSQPKTAELSPSKNASVQIQGFNQETDANQGLQQAIQSSLETLSAPAPQESQEPCPLEEGYPIHLTRQMSAAGSTSKSFPPVMIETQGTVLGVFPQSNLLAGESKTEEQTIYLTPERLSLTGTLFDIKLDSGIDPASAPPGFDVGLFGARADNGLNWRVFTQPSGAPFGVTQQVLIPQGTSPDFSSEQLQKYSL